MVNIIVAVSENLVIGKDNKLLWRQSADLKRFKELTTNKTVIMGRKTYESIGKPLPNRRNIIISKQDIKIDGCEISNSISNSISKGEDVFIIGGGEIYKEALQMCDRIYLTKIHANFEGDTYFPILGDDWIVDSEERFTKDEKNKYDYSYITLLKYKK